MNHICIIYANDLVYISENLWKSKSIPNWALNRQKMTSLFVSCKKSNSCWKHWVKNWFNATKGTSDE